MNRIKQVRSSLNMSQTEFAKQIGVSQQTLSSLENDSRPVSERNIISICSVFGVDETWLRTGKGEPFPEPSPEDLALDDAFFALQVDDMDPFRKSLARAALELIATLPEEAMPALKKFLQDANDAIPNEKDEE